MNDNFDFKKFSKMIEGSVPKEALEYATSTLPDVDQDFFDMYVRKFAPRNIMLCPFCGKQSWEVSPFFGLLISLRGAGPAGNFPTKDIFVTVKCANCKYVMLFDVREVLERLKEKDTT
jgi:hypothetical protein